MTQTAVLVWIAAVGALFEPVTIPLEGPAAHVFLAHGDGDFAVDLFVVEGRTLTVYPEARPTNARTVRTAAGVTAFDVADTDGDGRPEVIAIAGEDVLRYAIPAGNEPASGERLFEARTLLSGGTGRPCPRVLVVEDEGRPVLALPTDAGLELRTVEGDVVMRRPWERGPGLDAPLSRPFEYWVVEPPQAGEPRSLEMKVVRWFEPRARLGDAGEAFGAQTEGVGARAGGTWFPLRKRGEGETRVFYARSDTEERSTVVWLGGRAGADDAGGGGRQYHYPGTLVGWGGPPADFNGDGFSDLLLWSAPPAGRSLGSLTRALTAGTWPTHLMVHLFAAERERHAPEPTSRMVCRVPLGRFLNPESATPLRNLALKDFDGDGETDIGFSARDDGFSVWLSRDGVFSEKPDYRTAFGEAVEGVAFVADLDGQGRTTIGLRSARALHVLHPAR